VATLICSASPSTASGASEHRCPVKVRLAGRGVVSGSVCRRRKAGPGSPTPDAQQLMLVLGVDVYMEVG